MRALLAFGAGRRWAASLLLALGAGSCVVPYVPDVVNTSTKLLVVDGFINGNGRTVIKLARTQDLTATTAPPPEKGARLFMVDEQGTRHPLAEKSAGLYQSDSLLLPTGHRYQLRITTAGSSAANYESDLVTLKVTPPIDKVGFQLADDQVQLLVSTHDPSAQTRYYRWSFVETWEFNAAFRSVLEYIDGQLKSRVTPIYTCWRTERPTNIVQTTTAQLSQDAVTNYIVRSIPGRAERVKIRYSVLVSQSAETAEEFAYFELLRKNTEAVGTVNDPLPTQLTGNLHCVDRPSEPVLGYVSAHTVQYQRFFLDKSDLPARDSEYYTSPYADCLLAPLCFCDQFGCDKPGVIKLFASPENTPIDSITNSPDCNAGILGASTACADCRVRGTNNKPAFW